jgi:hypothetical protein
MTDSFYLGAYWKSRPCTLREYIADSKRFLARLGALHPIFQELVITGKAPASGVKLPPDLNNLDELLFRLAPCEDALFTHARPDGSPTLDSTSPMGFLTSYTNAQPPAQKVGVRITAGMDSPRLTNAVVIDLPMGVSEFRDYAFVRRLLETTVDCWAPSRAVVTSSAFRKKLGEPGGSQTIGWMTWFDDPAVCKVLPETIQSEPIAGGLLVTTTQEVISPDRTSHVAVANQIRNSLLKHGILQI